MKGIKIVRNIINKKLDLVGFVLQGTERQFGGASDTETKAAFDIKTLASKNFANGQIRVNSDGTIMEEENFRLNSIPLLVIDNGKYTNLAKAQLMLSKQLKVDGVVEGYVVDVLCEENGMIQKKFSARMKTEDIIRYYKWIPAANFMVRTSQNDNRFVTGKGGTVLSELPFEEITSKKETKSVKRTQVEKKDEAIHATGEKRYDILDVYGFIEEVGGMVIKLPEDKYESTTKSTTEVGDRFVDSGIGEITTPKLSYKLTEFNINTKFRKIGSVEVSTPEGVLQVPTFIWRDKSIFKNGEMHLNRFGVILPEQRADEFASMFGKEMMLSEFTNEKIKKAYIKLLGRADVRFYLVDVSKMNLMSENKIEKSLMTVKVLTDTLLQYSANKLIANYLGGRGENSLKNKIARERGTTAQSLRDILPEFKALSEDVQKALEDAGIRLSDGSYSEVKPKEKKEGEETKTKEATQTKPVIKIDYKFDDNSTQTLESILNGEKNVGGIYQVVAQKLVGLEFASDEMVSAMNEVLAIANKNADYYKEKIWKHNCAAYLKGGKEALCMHEADEWEDIGSGRLKTGTFIAPKGGHPLNLKAQIVNISLKK